MTTLINKIEHLIKREKTTPERNKKDDCAKSSSEILSELFGAFNADPPKIDETVVKKSKKSKKKHKKEKKKRSRSSDSSSDSDSDYSHRRKKRKKSKSKKRKDTDKRKSRSPSYTPPSTPVKIKSEQKPIKFEKSSSTKKEPDIKSTPIVSHSIKSEPKEEKPSIASIKKESIASIKKEEDAPIYLYTEDIPMPASPNNSKLDSSDLRFKLENKKVEAESDKSKSKIQIKNLKFSAIYEETVKKAEEEAKKKAKQREEGEYTDSSDSSVKEESNSQFPKSSDPGGILTKKAADDLKVSEDEKKHSKKSSKSESSHKSSKRDRSRSRKRSSSKSRRSRSRSRSRRHHRSTSKSRKRSRSRHRSSSRSRRSSPRSRRSRLSPRTRRRSRSRSRHRSSSRKRRDSRSPTGVKLADSEKKRLLEVARRNAINMLKNGAVPAGAAALPPHTRNQVMAAIQSGGKSVDELTDFCKHLSKKEALGELSSVSSNDEGASENEDTIAFHHPFLVKEKAPIVLNIRGAAPLPIKSGPTVPVANKEELRLQFPVSSGSQHREKASEWVPVSPKKDNMQVAKLNSKPAKSSSPETAVATTGVAAAVVATTPVAKAAPLALPAPPAADPPPYIKNFTTGAQLTSVAVATLPPPGPQAYPPGIEQNKTKIDMAAIVSQKIAMIRREQEENELGSTTGFGFRGEKPGQFTGSTGANILTPRELAAGQQAWAKKDQLQRAAPVEGGMGMTLLQKMGWTPGQGLGKEGTGTLQPLLLEVKLDTKGLQAKEEASNRHNRGMKCHRAGRRGGGGGGGGGGPMPLVAGGKHPVSLLGEYCSKQKLGPPEYTLCFECGPDHKKNFLFKVKVAGTEYQPAVASANKKQAKADAAQLALQKLGIVTS